MRTGNSKLNVLISCPNHPLYIFWPWLFKLSGQPQLHTIHNRIDSPFKKNSLRMERQLSPECKYSESVCLVSCVCLFCQSWETWWVFSWFVLLYPPSPLPPPLLSRSRIHEHKISLRFLCIILRVLRLEVFVYNVYTKTSFKQFLLKGGGGKIRK